MQCREIVALDHVAQEIQVSLHRSRIGVVAAEVRRDIAIGVAELAFEARLDAVAVRLLGRTFSAPERAVLQRTLDDALAVYRRDPAQARALLAVGESPVEADLPAPELAAWTLVASQVMNLDESLTK